MSRIALGTLLIGAVAVALWVAATGPSALAANNSEQVVFSGGGAFPGVTPFGFWIWCEAQSSNPYQGQCNGAMYFYALGITKHVAGMVTEVAPDMYEINVVSTADGSVACSLTNTPPVTKGPKNTVEVTCTAPSAVQNMTGTSTTAVVNVTGP